VLAPEKDVDWIYYSFEIDRVQKEFKLAGFFFWHDHDLTAFRHYNGQTYEIGPDYLMGKLVDPKTKELVPVMDEHREILFKIYEDRIIPLFGEYDDNGIKLKRGRVDFIEQRDNPTGIRNYLLSYAREHGEFIEQKYIHVGENKKKEERARIVGYKPHDPDKTLIVILDHIRKMNKERGYTLKENMDKMVEYQVELRNWCKFIFVDIVHLNRSMSNIERIKYMKDCLYPNGDDVKDSGNISEEANYLITMFNPNDDKYNLAKHFGLNLVGQGGKLLYPKYRSIHLVDSRDTECPRHIQTNMFGNRNTFESIHNKKAEQHVQNFSLSS
jgi:hypothetical protein